MAEGAPYYPEQYDSFMITLAGRKEKTADQPTKIKDQQKTKAHMPPPKITDSTPDEIDQVDLIADPAEEEYLGFGGMCG